VTGGSGPARPELLVVAQLTRPHGVRGEMAARLAAVDARALLAIPLLLRPAGGAAAPARLVGARPREGGWILSLEGVADRTGAEALRGAVLLARRADLPAAGRGEWYVADLVGLRVVDAEAGEIGRLEEVLKVPANDVLVVRGARGEVLIPALEDVILGVDAESGVMRVRLPSGLLDPPPPREPGEDA
jgi:16S rRNA processing protein RimM